jgi:hypothetical protein
MRNLSDVKSKHAKLAKDFIDTLDKTLQVYVNVFDDIFVSGLKNGQVVYREFKPWS